MSDAHMNSMSRGNALAHNRCKSFLCKVRLESMDLLNVYALLLFSPEVPRLNHNYHNFVTGKLIHNCQEAKTEVQLSNQSLNSISN